MMLTLFAPLAHGSLGAWDEIVPIIVGVIFGAFVVFVWLRSRRFQPEYDEQPGEE